MLCGCMVMRGEYGILLSEGFEVSFGHLKVSDLHGQPQDPLGCRTCSTTFLAASACPTPALEAWGGQMLFLLHSQCLACAGWPGNDRWVPRPMRLPFVGDYWLFL